MRIRLTHILWFITAILFGSSLFFTINIIDFKNKLNRSSLGLVIDSGQTVTVVKIIDGDEVSVKYNNKQFIVRLLGIVSYDPNVNNFSFRKDVAKELKTYLDKTLLNREVALIFDEFKQDSKKRLLSYIQQENIDIGETMLSRGLSVVYTKYPFSRMDRYLKTEQKARRDKAGVWRYPTLTKQVLQMKALWEKEKKKEMNKEAENK